MVKTVELMGLATFNVFIALSLSATVLNNRDSAGITALSQENVSAFVTDIASVSGGQSTAMSQHTLVEYLMARITEDSRYTANITYSVGDSGPKESAMEMGRMEFISHVLKGMKTMEKHETKTRIDYIKIDKEGRKAHVIMTNFERGFMPVEDAFGDIQKVPILGTSHCEQNIILNTETIQLDGAECTTTISFENAF